MCAILDALDTNAHALGKKIGASDATIHQVASGRNKLSGDVILKIHEHFPQLNLSFARKGEGEVLVSTPSETPIEASLSIIAQELTEIRKLISKTRS